MPLLQYSSLLQLCSPKCAIPLNIATVAESPWDQWPPCPPLSLFLAKLALSCGEALWTLIEFQLKSAQQLALRDGVGEKTRDSPRLPHLQDTVRVIDNQVHQALLPHISLSHFKENRICVSEMCHEDHSSSGPTLSGFSRENTESKYYREIFFQLIFNSLYPVGISNCTETKKISFASMHRCLSCF